jgi:hypothetical protein
LIAAPADGWAPDAAFEATRKELIGAAIRQQGARVAAAAIEAGEIALVPLTEDVPYPKAVTPTSSVQFGTHDPIVVGKSGRIVAATYGAVGRKYPLYYVDDADQQRVVELAVHDIRAFAVSDDGARVLIGASPIGPGVDSLSEVTLATGESRLIWSSPSEKIRGLSWVGDRVFVMTDKKLYWLRVDTGDEIATAAAGGMWLRSLRDGCVQTIYNSSNKLFLIGAAGDKLKILAKLATPGGVTIVETPDAIQAFVLAGGRSTAFERLNVDEAYRAFADKTKPKKRASGPRT